MGGAAKQWASSNYSPPLSASAARLRCDDPTAKPVLGTNAEGQCVVVHGSCQCLAPAISGVLGRGAARFNLQPA
jgi:hypothetical protein